MASSRSSRSAELGRLIWACSFGPAHRLPPGSGGFIFGPARLPPGAAGRAVLARQVGEPVDDLVAHLGRADYLRSVEQPEDEATKSTPCWLRAA